MSRGVPGRHVFAACCAVLALATDADAQWQRTYAWNPVLALANVAPAPSRPNRIYACSGNAPPLLFSDDAGLSWQQTPAPELNANASSVTVDPEDADIIYVSTSAGLRHSLYRSRDGGKTFDRLEIDAATIAIDPRAANILYAARAVVCSASSCTVGGIAKSSDGGATWQDTARVDSSNFLPVIDPNDTRWVYSVGYDLPLEKKTGGLYRTSDGGATWPSLYEGLVELRSLAVDARSRLYVLNDYHLTRTLLRSEDHGDSWTALPTDPQLYLSSVVSDPRDPNTIYAAVSGSADEGSGPAPTLPCAVVSRDDGHTWSPLGACVEISFTNIVVSRAGVVLALAADGIYRYSPPSPRRRAVSK